MHVDPPEVRQFASRGDPPVSRWPGSIVTTEGLMAAGGDPRDWFRYGHRAQAYTRVWAEFRNARNRRRNFMAGYDWNQILILGDYGSGKTTLGVHHALKYFRRGHPVFSNASALFGWHLEHEEMYTAMGFMPANSLLLIDESSAALASRVGHGVAVASFSEMNLNTRKRNCKVIYMSAQDWEISASIRRNCREVWMPVAKGDLSIEDAGSPASVADANNPSNFRLVWHVWDDYPYRKANLIEGPDPNSEGFGSPSYTMFDEGENVRRAYLLNDTFESAKAGAATTASRDTVKERLSDFLAGRGPRSNAANGDGQFDQQMADLLIFFARHEEDPPEFWKAAEIGAAIGTDGATAGKFLQALIPGVSPVGKRGYRAVEIYGRLDAVAEQAAS